MTPNMAAGGHAYRSDIDGLRAIAVLAVVIGHAFDSFLPSGYLGVDVFFVISGFVIAMSLLNRDQGPLTTFIASFYLRRFKRLMPALLVCFLVTCAILLLIDTSPKVSLITGALALFGFSNFYLYDQKLDYFAASTEYNAFTHTWSLGVEEQFYFIFPFVFWLVFRFAQQRSSVMLGTMIGVLSLLSLISFLALQDQAPSFAYYLMQTRFWEIGTGVVIACCVHKGITLPRVLTGLPASMLYLALLAAVFVLIPGTAIYGHVCAVVLSGLLIWSGAFSDKANLALTNPLSMYLGRISYSLYLWHWPFLVFGLLSLGSWVANPIWAMLAALGAAILSYHFVEQPVRRIPTPFPKVRHFATTFGAIFAAIAVIAFANDQRKQMHQQPFELALRPEFLTLPGSDMTFNPHCVVADYDPALHLKPDTFDKCTFGPLAHGDGRTLWVFGDSHAGHLQGGLLKLREEAGFGLHLIETPSQVFPSINGQEQPDRIALMADVKAHWKPGDVLVLARLMLSRTDSPEVLWDIPDWLAQVDALASEVGEAGINIVIMSPPPMFTFEDLRACDPADVLSCSIVREAQRVVVETVLDDMQEIASTHENVAVFDVFEAICPAVAPICSPLREGAFIYRDRDHLNVYGAELVMPALARVLDDFSK